MQNEGTQTTQIAANIHLWFKWSQYVMSASLDVLWADCPLHRFFFGNMPRPETWLSIWAIAAGFPSSRFETWQFFRRNRSAKSSLSCGILRGLSSMCTCQWPKIGILFLLILSLWSIGMPVSPSVPNRSKNTRGNLTPNVFLASCTVASTQWVPVASMWPLSEKFQCITEEMSTFHLTPGLFKASRTLCPPQWGHPNIQFCILFLFFVCVKCHNIWGSVSGFSTVFQ